MQVFMNDETNYFLYLPTLDLDSIYLFGEDKHVSLILFPSDILRDFIIYQHFCGLLLSIELTRARQLHKSNHMSTCTCAVYVYICLTIWLWLVWGKMKKRKRNGEERTKEMEEEMRFSLLFGSKRHYSQLLLFYQDSMR